MEAAKPRTLVEYANSVLNSEAVQVLLNSIGLSNKVADDLIESVGLDMGTEAFLYGIYYRDALRHTKYASLAKIIQEAMPWKWMPTTEAIELVVAGKEKPGEPTLAELPLVTFYAFLFDEDFRPFLLGEKKFAWTTLSLPPANTLLFVFVLFLWLKMDARYDPTKGISYYVEAVRKGKRDVSSIESRAYFLRVFGDYIHTDLRTATDYEKLGKQGTLLRLRLSDSNTGRIVIQGCGEMVPDCNRLYAVTDRSIEELMRLYLKEGTLTRATVQKSDIGFKCYKCQGMGAYLFHANDKTRFYCNEACYTKS